MNFFTNNTGFFQGGKSFGGKGVSAGISDLTRNLKPKLYPTGYNEQGVRVCPWTGKPLQTPTELQTGVSDEARLQMPELNTTGGSKFMSGIGGGSLPQTGNAQGLNIPQLGGIGGSKFMPMTNQGGGFSYGV